MPPYLSVKRHAVVEERVRAFNRRGCGIHTRAAASLWPPDCRDQGEHQGCALGRGVKAVNGRLRERKANVVRRGGAVGAGDCGTAAAAEEVTFVGKSVGRCGCVAAWLAV
eukprot:359779-Chlamydomonas_euryale.AAC.1